MTGLWLAKHNDGNAWYHIYPFVNASNIKLFHVVRHKKTPREIKGAKWHLYSNNGLLQGLIAIFLKGNEVLRKNHIDFIVSFNPVPWGAVAWLLAKIYRKPIIMGLIGADFHTYLLRSRLRIFLKLILTKSDIITVTGSDMRSYLVENSIKEFDRIYIYPHCIDETWFVNNRSDLNLVNKRYDLITVADLIPRKKVETIIKAVYLLLKRGYSISFCIVGDGEERDFLKNLVNDYNIQFLVHFTGYSTRVLEYLKLSKIYVQASNSEGFSISLVEAMAAGLVPVITNAGSEKDYIQDNANGLYFEIGNAEELAEKIISLQNKETYERLQKNVLEYRNNFYISNAIKTCEQIINFIKVN